MEINVASIVRKSGYITIKPLSDKANYFGKKFIGEDFGWNHKPTNMSPTKAPNSQ